MLKNRNIFFVILFIAIYLYILSPYFLLYGKVIHGGMFGVLIIIALGIKGLNKLIDPRLFILSCIFVFLTVWTTFIGVIVSQSLFSSHQIYFIYVIVYIVAGYLIGNYFVNKGYEFKYVFIIFLKFFIFVALLNSIIIITQFYVPSFRAAIEGILYLSPDSNINYATRAYRLRGLAAGGGGSQSLFLGAAIFFAVSLYISNYFKLLSAIIYSCVIGTAMLFVGRTGFLIAAISITLLVTMNFLFINRKSFRAFNMVFIFAILIASIPITLIYFVPQQVANYSLLFFYGGVESVVEEGTVTKILSFFHLPYDLFSLFFGIGDGTGGFTSIDSTDSGYMKMLTALGLPLSIFFYCLVLMFGFKILKKSQEYVLMAVFMFVLFLSEVKEPFILKGYLARAFWLLSGLSIVYSSFPYYFKLSYINPKRNNERLSSQHKPESE